MSISRYSIDYHTINWTNRTIILWGTVYGNVQTWARTLSLMVRLARSTTLTCSPFDASAPRVKLDTVVGRFYRGADECPFSIADNCADRVSISLVLLSH